MTEWTKQMQFEVEGRGTVDVLVRSDGLFVLAISNQVLGYRWTEVDRECDFRRMLLRFNAGYVWSKVSGKMVVDAESSRMRIVTALVDALAEGRCTRQQADDAMRRVEDIDGDDLQEFVSGLGFLSEYDFDRQLVALVNEPWSFRIVEAVLPRIQEALRAEIDREAMGPS